MSTKYSKSKDVPTEILLSRVEEIISWITSGDKNKHYASEITMRIPAEVDRDADLVLGEVARRLEASLRINEQLRKSVANWKQVADEAIKFKDLAIKKNEEQKLYIESLESDLKEAKKTIESFEKALTPSKETAEAYIGEFYSNDCCYNTRVSWTTIQEIMKTILERAKETK